MRKVSTHMALAMACLLIFTGSGRADIVHLSDGRAIEGKVVEQGDLLQVYKSSHSFITLNKSDVVRVEESDAPLEVFEQRIATLGNDAAGWWSLAQFCDEHNLREERERALAKLLALEPDHLEARAALGYEQVDGVWYRGKDLAYVKKQRAEAGRSAEELRERIARLEMENEVEMIRYRDARGVTQDRSVEGQRPPLSVWSERERGAPGASPASVVIERVRQRPATSGAFGLPQSPTILDGRDCGRGHGGRLAEQNIIQLNGTGGEFGGRRKSPIMISTEVPTNTIGDNKSDNIGVNSSFSFDGNSFRINLGITGRKTQQRTQNVTSSRLTQFIGYR